MFAISVLVFLIFFATPGVDPAARIAGRNADQQTLREVRKDFGLDRPMPVQYALMMKKLFISRDLTSFVNRGAKVIPQVVEAAPVTLQPRARRVGDLDHVRHRDRADRRRLPRARRSTSR